MLSFCDQQTMREILIENAAKLLFKKNTRLVEAGKKICDIVDKVPISLEVCPNRALDAELLCRLDPRFCSVTWLDVQRPLDKTPALELAREVQSQGQDVLLHLAGRNLCKTDAFEILNLVKAAGIRNILALQGDPSHVQEKDDSKCDFPYASDLVRFIRANFQSHFCIAAAGYPELHPDSEHLAHDLHFLKKKVEEGVDFIVTQAVFSYPTFDSFCKSCRAAQIQVPIAAGVYVISSHSALVNMAAFCKMPVPKAVMDVVYENRNNPEAVQEYGICLAVELIKDVLKSGNAVHLFTLNNLELVEEVFKRIFDGTSIERPLKLL